jgi:hypothetical protein
VYIKIFKQPMIILNGLQSARDLLDKRSSIYSDRPRFVLLSELCVAQNFTRRTRSLTRTLMMQHGMEQRVYSSAIVSLFLSVYFINNNRIVDPDSESIVGS